MFAVSYGAQLSFSANRARCAAGGDLVVVVVPGQRGGNLSDLTAHTLGAVGRKHNSGSSKEQAEGVWLKQDQPESKGKCRASQAVVNRHGGVVSEV